MKKLDVSKRADIQKILDDSNIDELLRIMNLMDDETRALVLQALTKRLDVNRKAQTLVKIREIIASKDQLIKDWVVTAISNSYVAGANLMYADLRKLGVKAGDTEVFKQEFTADIIKRIDLMTIHKDAINALISDTYLDIANGMNGLVAGAERQMNDALKRQIRAINISKQITGTSIRTISKEVQEAIGQQGFSVLIDRGGRKWTIARYAEMIVRTHTVKAANEGVVNRASEWGVDIVEVSTHAGTCDICKSFEGKLFSISGKSDKYPALVEQPPFHPRCRHSLLPRPFAEIEDIDS